MANNTQQLREDIELILTFNMPIHPEHQIDKRNILNNIMPLIEAECTRREQALLDEFDELFDDVNQAHNKGEDVSLARARFFGRAAGFVVDKQALLKERKQS